MTLQIEPRPEYITDQPEGDSAKRHLDGSQSRSHRSFAPLYSASRSIRWQHASANFAKADAIEVTFVPAGDAKRIAVFEPFARFAIR